MEERFGQTQVTSLGTYTTAKIKAAITDLARYEGVNIGLVRKVCARLGEEENLKTMEDFFKVACKDAEIKAFVLTHLELINDVFIYLNTPKTASIHACGTVLYPKEKTAAQWIPVKKQQDLIVTEWEGAEIEDAGFVKEDILGIQQLSQLSDILKLVKENRGIEIDLYKDVPLDDPMVFEYIKKGYLGNVFHFGAKGLSKYCIQMQPESLDEMAICAALYRPGPIENNIHNEYILTKRGEREQECFIGTEEILKPNLNFLCYQEDIMRICQFCAGFDLEETDGVRKCIYGEELVWTPEGAVKLKDVRPYTEVSTYNEKECRSKYNKVRKVVSKKQKQCIKLKIQGGNSLTCTPDHKILTEVGWLEAKDCVGHYVYKDLSRRFGKLSKSKEELYLMVALLTEGSLSRSQCSFVNKDERELKEFERCYKVVFGKELKRYYNEHTGCISFYIKQEEVQSLGLDLVKSKDKMLPDYVFSLNEEGQLFVLGKLIDFDGYISSKKGGFIIAYSSKSLRLIEQINILFNCCGVLTTRNRRSFEKYPEDYWDIGISYIEDALKIKEMLQDYSWKINERFNFKLEDFDNDSFSPYKIPFEIWQPIIKNLIENSGYNCNELLGCNVLSWGINKKFDLTNRRVEKILKRCGRSKFLENALKGDFCFVKVESYEDAGILPVYDFTMASDRSPYAFIGGILAHNCIGKKKVDKLRSYGEKFVKGYVDRYKDQGVTEKYAWDLWHQMEEFGKYSFNKSHAVAYSRNGYNCIWLKVHYPIEFWSVTFSWASQDDYPSYINEIQKSGDIKILPTDINKSDSIIVSDIKTNSMYWALNSVKQCGEKAQQFISEEKKKNGPFFSLDEFIDRCVIKNSPVNKSVIENLIYAGAFDEIERIEKPKERIRLINSYRENKRVKIIEEKDTLTKAVSVDKDKEDWWWTLMQKKISGFAEFDYQSLIETYHIDKCGDVEYFDLSNLKYLDDSNKEQNYHVIVGGCVLELQERKSKKGLFATITLESNYEFIPVLIFPEYYDEFKEILSSSIGNILLINGYLQWDKFRQEYVLQSTIDTYITVLT